jgi:hypothetical protein
VEDGLECVKGSLADVVTGNAEILDAVQNPGRSSNCKDWDDLSMEEAQHERALGDQCRTSGTARMQSANIRIADIKFHQKASLLPKEVLEEQNAALMSLTELKSSARAKADAAKLAAKTKKAVEKAAAQKVKSDAKATKVAEKETKVVEKATKVAEKATIKAAFDKVREDKAMS